MSMFKRINKEEKTNKNKSLFINISIKNVIKVFNILCIILLIVLLCIGSTYLLVYSFINNKVSKINKVNIDVNKIGIVDTSGKICDGNLNKELINNKLDSNN